MYFTHPAPFLTAIDMKLQWNYSEITVKFRQIVELSEIHANRRN